MAIWRRSSALRSSSTWLAAATCRVVVDTLSKTVSLYREYGHEPVPPDAKDRLYAVLKLEARS